MKALSIRQPWPWAIFNGKDVENRSRRTSFRGSFLIHAGKRVDFDGYEWLKKNREWLGLPEIPPISSFPTGGIVGRARIVDCVKKSKSKWFWGRFGYKIKNARPVEFCPCKGQLGFFESPVDPKEINDN